MVIKSLKLKNYRNYDLLDLKFDPKTNILYGDNAQGKTNILEALYLSGTTKSHRGTKDRDVIQFGYDESHIETIIEKRNIDFQIDMHLKKNSPKGIAIDKVPIRRAGELFGIVHFVFFSPEDLNIIKEGPAGRRRFIDLELSQLDKIYLNNLSNYNRIINQRNSLLKDIYGQRNLIETLDIWDMQLAEYGKKILERRKQFIKQVNDIIADIHYKLTGGKERITLTYESSLGNITFETALSKYRERDLRMKSTTVGPHRDDICFTTDAGLDIRKFGSQGQQRTAALSLKLSEIELVKEELKVHFKPEFLNRIDEIVMFNSLDSSVVRKIIDKFIGQLVHRLQDKKITISLTDQAYQMIQEEGFDPIYGARPLKRFIQSQIETKLAKEIIKGTVHQGQHVEVDYQDEFVLKAQ